MDLVETKKVLAYVAAAFPRYYANVTRSSADRQAIVWNDALADYSVDAVMTGVKSYISVDSSGFPPSPGQIIEHIHFVGNPRDHSGTEAWALVRKAVNVPWDQFDASFATLPRAAQIAVGTISSAISAPTLHFLRMYEAAQIRAHKEQREPTAAISMRERLQKELEARRPVAKAISAAAPEPTKAIETKGTTAPADKMQALRARLGG